MTLIVGIKPPFFGVTENIAKGMLANGMGLRRGVILATDSRWTVYRNLANPAESFDIATKLFRITANMAICYAGNSSVAESVVELLEQKKKAGSLGSLGELSIGIQDLWTRHPESKNPAISRLVLMLAHMDRTKNAHLWLFDSMSNFVAEELDSGWFEGPTTASTAFESYLQKTINDQLYGHMGNSMDLLNPRDWELLIAQAFDNAILDKKLEPTVGGGLQMISLDEDGFHSPTIKRIDLDKSGLPTTKNVVQVSADQTDLRLWGQFKRTL